MKRLGRLGGPRLRALGRAPWGRFSRGYLVDCSKVYVSRHSRDTFVSRAACKIRAGEQVEQGVVRILPVDGKQCTLVHPWPSSSSSTWASGSGCVQFYTTKPSEASAKLVPSADEAGRYEVLALRDIEAHEELTLLDESLSWRGPAKIDRPQSQHQEPSLVDCSKVEARPDAWGGVGVYATEPIRKGDVVERGVVQRLPVDGNECPYVFTWSEDRSVWATGSGCSVFYNASLDGSENTSMTRNLDDDTFEIYAIRDIEKGEELTHLYKSIDWRSCFTDLKALRDKTLNKLDKERAEFAEYWADHLAPTIEKMMLDDDAASIDKLERPEILSQIPSFTGKEVLELGAGIGRFSGVLARKARKVTAVDFVATSCVEIRKANAEKNLEVIQADVTTLDFPLGSFDLVFSNWLFMYLTDEECRELAAKLLRWLRPGGHVFFRESCFHASGNAARRFNPTKYRTPEQYSGFFSDAEAGDFRYQLSGTNFVESYAQLKGNMHQYWFRWQKVSPASERHLMTLQTGQYAPAKILRYEKIYGRGYVYTGGDEISQKILELAQPLREGASVLDIGFGAGGTAYYLAQHCAGVYVHGINWSSELASFNAGRLPQVPTDLRDRVSFELTPECGVPENELRYPPNIFDLVILRETLMYLDREDKAVILRKIKQLLRPGGCLVVLDYCAGQKELSATFQEHCHRWHYECIPPAENEELLKNYFQVESQDLTASFIKYMEEGLENIEQSLGPKSWKSSQMDMSRLESGVKDALESLPEEVVEEASQAAMQKVKLYEAALASESERLKDDYLWARETWALEKEAAETGDLKWYLFLARAG